MQHVIQMFLSGPVSGSVVGMCWCCAAGESGGLWCHRYTAIEGSGVRSEFVITTGTTQWGKTHAIFPHDIAQFQNVGLSVFVSQAEELMRRLCEVQSLSGVCELYRRHMTDLMQWLFDSHHAWTGHSIQKTQLEIIAVQSGERVEKKVTKWWDDWCLASHVISTDISLFLNSWFEFARSLLIWLSVSFRSSGWRVSFSLFAAVKELCGTESRPGIETSRLHHAVQTNARCQQHGGLTGVRSSNALAHTNTVFITMINNSSMLLYPRTLGMQTTTVF